MADTDDVPPLEDMTDLLEKVQIIREIQGKKSESTSKITNGHSHSKKDVENHSVQETSSSTEQQSGSKTATKSSSTRTTTTIPSQSNKSSSSSSTTTTKSEGFGGMKKGFMFGGSSTKPTEVKPKEEPVPFIQKKEEPLKINEVQQAMSDTITSKKDEWMTDDLLEQIQKNETLVKKLQDPRFMEAVHMFQTNPTAAMEQYKNDKETQDAFKEFCGLMGNHFSSLADKGDNIARKETSTPKIIEEIDPSDTNKYTPTKPPSGSERGTILTKQTHDGADLSVRSSTNPHQATAEDEKKMQEILSSPDMLEVFMDPWIQDLFQTLRSDPDSGQRLLREANDEKKKKIEKLVSVGLLQLQS